MESRKGLKILVTYHGLLGHTYLGWTFYQKESYLVKILRITWSALFFIYFLFYSYTAVRHIVEYTPPNQNHLKQAWVNRSNCTLLIRILEDARVLCNASQIIMVALILLFRGKTILMTISSWSLDHISNEEEKKTGLTLTLAMLSTLIFQVVMMTIYCFTGAKSYEDGITKIIGPVVDVIRYFVNYSTELTLISLIAYQSRVIGSHLRFISNNLSKYDLDFCLVLSHRLSRHIRAFDKLICSYTLLALAINSLICISFICKLFVDQRHNITGLSALVESAGLLLGLCLACDSLPTSYDHFYHQLTDYRVSGMKWECAVITSCNRIVELLWLWMHHSWRPLVKQQYWCRLTSIGSIVWPGQGPKDTPLKKYFAKTIKKCMQISIVRVILRGRN